MGHPELLVPWQTITKNLLKEQLLLEMKPFWYPKKNSSSNASSSSKNQIKKVRTDKSDVTDRVFGGRLEQHYYLEDDTNPKRFLKLPPILYKIFDFLTSDRAVRSVGLFRMLAPSSQTLQLIEQFNAKQKAGDNFNSIVFDNTTDPNVVANLLKEYLRNLQIPLLHPVTSFMEISQIQDTDKRLVEFMKAFKKLDHNIYRRVFRELIEVLNEFIYHSHLNKLNSRVLSLCIGPYLFQQQKDQSIQSRSTNSQFYYNIIGMCMEHFDKLFTEGYDYNTLEGGFSDDAAGDKRSGNTLAAFLEKMKDKGGVSSAANSFLSDVTGKKIENSEQDPSNSSAVVSNSNVPGTNSTPGDDMSDVQDKWREYVESWKLKYKNEKEEHEKAQAKLDELKKDWAKEKKQLEDEMQQLKMQLSSSDITEDDEIIQLEEERKKLIREIERERERYKLEKDSHDERMKKIKRRQLLALKKMGIEPTMDDATNNKLSPEFFKLRRQGVAAVTSSDQQQQQQEDDLGSVSSTLSSSATRTTVGSKIQVNDRFKKKK